MKKRPKTAIPRPALTVSYVAERPAGRHPVGVYLAHLGAGSRRTMQQALDTIADLVSGGAADAMTLDWTRLRYEHTSTIRTMLEEKKYAPATANKMLAALRGVLRESFRLGYMTAEQHQRAADIPTIRATTLPRGRALTGRELREVFRVCDDGTNAGVRDAALLAVACGAGLRRSELVTLNTEDFNAETGALTILGAKGRKDRIVYVTNGSFDALKEWLEVRGDVAGSIFVPVLKNDTVSVRRMTDQAVYSILQRRAEQAGIPEFSPHDLRRTFISDLLRATGDLNAAKELAGHASVTTTSLYDMRGEDAKKKAAAALHVPFRRYRRT